MQQSKLTEPWKKTKASRQYAEPPPSQAPLWRDNLTNTSDVLPPNSWSIQHLMAVMMQDQLEMRAENRRRTLVKRADFPQLKYPGDLLVDELPGTPARPCHCCGHWILSAKAAMWCSTEILVPARPIWPRLWESRPVPTE